MDDQVKISIVPIQIRFSDLDMARHVHHAVYMQWFELARMGLLRRFIPSDHDWRSEGVILARSEVDHHAPAHLHDLLVAKGWCSAIGTKSFDLRYTIEHVAHGRTNIVAEGRSVMVCFNYDADVTLTIPPTWRKALEEIVIP